MVVNPKRTLTLEKTQSINVWAVGWPFEILGRYASDSYFLGFTCKAGYKISVEYTNVTPPKPDPTPTPAPTPTPTPAPEVKPDLTPSTPSGWSAPLVVSTSDKSTSSTKSSFFNTDILYISWNVGCSGRDVGTKFYTRLYVDGSLKHSWYSDGASNGGRVYVIGYKMGNLSIGTHTLKIVTDADGNVVESNESNNTYAKTITVKEDPDCKMAIYVRFNSGGGIGTMSEEKKVIDVCSGTSINYYLPKCGYKKTGYHFIGWNVADACSMGEDLDVYTVGYRWEMCGNLTLTAVWEEDVIQRRVTFEKNGGSGGDDYVTATYGKPMPARKMPTRTGYTFSGYWDTIGANGKQYYAADGTSMRNFDNREELTLYAKWTVNTYKVTFGKNGGIGGDDYVTVKFGQFMPTRTMPKRVGYTFCGYWDTLNSGGKQYYAANGTGLKNFDKGANTTLWAKWTANNYTVTFGNNGGTGGSAYVTAAYGQSLPWLYYLPTRSGWTFAGYWDTLKTGGKMYYNANGVPVRNWDKTGNVALWAKWTARVTFGKNGGTGGDNYVTVESGKPMPTRAMPKRTGYTFGGYWDTLKSGGKQYYSVNGTGLRNFDKAGNTQFWAKWTVCTYKVTLGANGGSGGDAYVTATYGQKLPKRTMPRRNGWTFAGFWDTLKPGGKMYYDANGNGVRTLDVAGNITLWAKWTCKVTFGKNGGTGGDDYVTVVAGQPMPTRTMPKRNGYSFAGYWDSTGAGGKMYYTAAGASARNWDKTAGNTTIWAKWEKPLPDLVVENVKITGAISSNGRLAVGDDATLSFSIRNVGEGASPASVAHIYRLYGHGIEKTGVQEPSLLASCNVGTIAAGGRATCSYSLRDVNALNYTVFFIVADGTGGVSESNESNNESESDWVVFYDPEEPGWEDSNDMWLSYKVMSAESSALEISPAHLPMEVYGWLLDDDEVRVEDWVNFNKTAMVTFVPEFTGVCEIDFSADLAVDECIHVYGATYGGWDYLASLDSESGGWEWTSFSVYMEAGVPTTLYLELESDGCNTVGHMFMDGIHSFKMYLEPDSEGVAFNVSLNAAGGSVNTSSLTRTVGMPFGTLPTPVRSGYNFKGWYFTDKDGLRHRVTSETTAYSYINALKAIWE